MVKYMNISFKKYVCIVVSLLNSNNAGTTSHKD